MHTEDSLKPLKIALVVIGLFFVIGVFPAMMYLAPSWRWSPPQHEYEQMILGIYATLGVFLIRAARNPLENKSLIWFTVWSSVVHAGIMFFQALANPQEYPHLYGDVPALFGVAFVLAYLMPKKG